VQLTQIEAVFRSLKSELDIRPIYHQKEDRIDAHIFIAFLAYCLQVTLKNRTMAYAPGLTPQAILEKLGAIQMIDVCSPPVMAAGSFCRVILSRKTTSNFSCITCTWNFHLNDRHASQPPLCQQRWPQHDEALCGEDL